MDYLILTVTTILFSWMFAWHDYLRWRELWVLNHHTPEGVKLIISGSYTWHAVSAIHRFFAIVVGFILGVYFWQGMANLISFLFVFGLVLIITFIFSDGIMNAYKKRWFFATSNQTQAQTEGVAGLSFKTGFLAFAILTNVFKYDIQGFIKNIF